MKKFSANLPDQDLAYFNEHTEHFDEYVEAVGWAQDYARWNRNLMMEAIVSAIRNSGEVPAFQAELQAINCHHNYVAREMHYGQNVLVTRKGAVELRPAIWGSFRAAWARTHTSCAERAIRKVLIAAAMVQDARCRAMKRSAASLSKITFA